MWTDSTPTELNRLFMQIDADSDGRVTWEELLTFLLQKNEAEGESEKNSFIYDLEQVAAPPNVAHSTGMTQLITMADKEKYLSIGRDATLKFWNFGTMQHARTVSLPEKSWVNAACYCASCSRLALATAHSEAVNFRHEYPTCAARRREQRLAATNRRDGVMPCRVARVKRRMAELSTTRR